MVLNKPCILGKFLGHLKFSFHHHAGGVRFSGNSNCFTSMVTVANSFVRWLHIAQSSLTELFSFTRGVQNFDDFDTEQCDEQSIIGEHLSSKQRLVEIADCIIHNI